MNSIKFFGMIMIAAFITACASGRMSIPDHLSPAELIQRGQEASDRNKYNQALQYYEAIIERYPSYIDEICAAEYEIAFIHYKQKKYETATTELNALLNRYDTPDEELLPPQFKKLAIIVLAKIEGKRK